MIFIVASFGGIFGLCLGGSVISLVELFYFFTLRLYNIIVSRGVAMSSKHGDSKRVSISNNVKTLEINPRSFLQNFKSHHHQYERQQKWNKLRSSFLGHSFGSSGSILPTSSTLLGKTALHEYNKSGVQQFLK